MLTRTQLLPSKECAVLAFLEAREEVEGEVWVGGVVDGKTPGRLGEGLMLSQMLRSSSIVFAFSVVCVWELGVGIS